MTPEFVRADYRDARHARDLVWLMNEYARDPMGGGAELPAEISQRLPAALAERGDAYTILCYVDGEPAGLANCFEGFSTFKCRPLLNIHDMVVVARYRGQGLGRRLLEQVEALARERRCCKLTLEVLEGNLGARRTYAAFGFVGYELGSSTGKAQFWEKPLPTDDKEAGRGIADV